MFKDRHEAGKKLAQKLSRYRGSAGVVLALPRGGVVAGYEVARALSLPLDIIAVRKVGHPHAPEYAVGVVGENGNVIMNEAEAGGLDRAWLAGEIEREEREAKRRSSAYRGGRAPALIRGKPVIIVDDGIATGLTMRAALRSAQAQGAASIAVAVPVAPQEAVRQLMGEGADEVVVLEPPEAFAGAVGAHYLRFEQVEDAEVLRLLQKSAAA